MTRISSILTPLRSIHVHVGARRCSSRLNMVQKRAHKVQVQTVPITRGATRCKKSNTLGHRCKTTLHVHLKWCTTVHFPVIAMIGVDILTAMCWAPWKRTEGIRNAEEATKLSAVFSTMKISHVFRRLIPRE